MQQHAPAVKVGGRRLSLSARHKPHFDAAPHEPAPAKASDDSAVDYPRPTKPASDADRDDGPKKEKKDYHEHHDGEKNLPKMKKEVVHAKHESPTRESHLDHKGYGAGGRIAQPGGKMSL